MGKRKRHSKPGMKVHPYRNAYGKDHHENQNINGTVKEEATYQPVGMTSENSPVKYANYQPERLDEIERLEKHYGYKFGKSRNGIGILTAFEKLSANRRKRSAR